MDTWEYRVVDKDGKPAPVEIHDGQAAVAFAKAVNDDRHLAHRQPHRVERRRVGVWEPVETKEEQ